MRLSRTYQQLLLFVLIVAVDQATKFWIEAQSPFFHRTVIPGFFDLVKAHNFGVAFSIFAGWSDTRRQQLLLGATLGIALVVLIWWLRERRTPGLTSWLLVLILAGAAGNILDRSRLGYVVDFIDWHVSIGGATYHWPAFNIADTCISVGIVLLIFQNFLASRRR